ncbi:arginine--tRNA ligase [Miltoncostaea marina]|uniref:arginine--tRNA ligase n=1 Tax=Miltoncostaea marina TaxID=2843215 RepID=UPI001C3D13F6|nr:arginine--tRNA ligase [Miltoncostaea marina]
MADAPLLEPIRSALAGAAAAAVGAEPPAVPLAPPAGPGMGDIASPVAMTLAKAARRPPREIAESIAARLRDDAGAAGWLAGVEVAGPGFLNMTLAPAWFAAAASQVAAAGDGHGAGAAATPQAILLEFVSANPTGPLHVGHARQAAYGDALARLLAFAGHRVTREYYVNDWGRQMRLFGASVAARYAQECGRPAEVPEDGYHGDYVAAIARTLREEIGDRHADDATTSPEALELFAARGEELMLASIRGELARFRVTHDAYFSERSLHRAGRVRAGVAALEEAGDAYAEEGAVWFRTSAYGDTKDRVLVRSDGEPTYLAADVAYHLDKAGRGDDLLIDVLGADHHGYIARLRAVLAAGGHDPDALEVCVVQLVSLLERGEAKKMSKRAGTVVTLGDLLDDIGVDAARFFLVHRSHETPLDLDLDLAREQSQENPVYYVQYAHARVCSILAQAGDPVTAPGPPPALDPAERAVVMRLADWPTAVAEAQERRAPHRVAAYLIDLARDFHAFYHRCRVVGEAPEVQAFRLDVCRATAGTIRAGLGLLGVEAPESM